MRSYSFLSGLANGISQGLALGSQIKGVMKEGEADDIRKQSMQDADTQRQADVNKQMSLVAANGINGNVQQSQPVQQAQPQADLINPDIAAATNQQQPSSPMYKGIMGATQATVNDATQAPLINSDIANVTQAAQANPLAPQAVTPVGTAPESISETKGMGPLASSAENFKYQVGENKYDNRDDAQKAATGNVADQGTYFAKIAGERLHNFYLQNGDVEKAKAWQEFAKDSQGKQAIKLWAGGYTKAKSGDWDGAANDFGKYYTQFVNDGVDYVGHKTLKDDQGNVTGFTIDLKNKETGKTSTLPMTPNDMIALSNSHNPQTVFEEANKQLQEAQKAKLALALEDRKATTKLAGDVTLEGLKAKNKINEINVKSKNDRGGKIEEITTEQNLKNAAPGETGKKVRDLQNSGLFTTEQIQRMVIASSDTTGKSLSEDRIRLAAYNKLAADTMTKHEVKGADGKTEKLQFGKMSKEQKQELIDRESSLISKQSGSTQSPSPMTKGFATVLDTRTGQTKVIPK